MTAFIKFFIHQHKAINLLVALVLILGTLTFINGRKERFPAIGTDVITITTLYPGASAENVERIITEKIENKIDNIEGNERMTSYSTEGVSVVRFAVDRAVNRLNSAIIDDIETELATISFPEDVEDPRIRDFSFGSSRANLTVGFIGNLPLEDLKVSANHFKTAAQKLAGVSKVELRNYPKLQVWVEILPEKLQTYNIDLNSVITAIQAQNISLPAGTVNIDGKEFFIHTREEYQSLADIENTVIRANDNGQFILLKDLATIGWAHEELRSYRRVAGGNSIWLNVYKTTTGDTIKVSQAVKELIAYYESNQLLPAGVSITITDDLAFYVERRLGILSSNATLGLLLVFLCMIIFFNFRVTLWTMLGIPFSFCLTIILAYSLGLTLNLMTMFGLIVVVGMIVDDAIIIAENIYAHAESGKSFYDAAIAGTREMFIPVIAIISTTILAFLPLTTLPGLFGDVLSLIPQIIIIALLCSLVECIFILPGHLAYLKHKKNTVKISTNTNIAQRSWYTYVNARYKKFLQKICRHPFLTASLTLLVLVTGTYFTGRTLPFIFFPGKADSIYIDIETPVGSSLAFTEGVIDKAEARIREQSTDTITELVSTVGRDAAQQSAVKYQSYLGNIRVILDPARQTDDDTISTRLEATLAAIPEISKYNILLQRGGPHVRKPIDVYVTGKALNEILIAVDDVYQFIQALPNTKAHNISYEEGKEELTILPVIASLIEFDIEPQATATSLRYALAEAETTTLRSLGALSRNEDEVELIVKYKTASERNLANIYEIPVRNTSGINIPLSNFTTTSTNNSSIRLVKEDGDIFISVTALLKDRRRTDYNVNVLHARLQEQIPSWQAKFPNLAFTIKGQKEHQDELVSGLLKALLLALFSIYFVLTVLFKSYTQPLIIMSIIPLGFCGVIIGLFLTATPLGLLPFLGAIALMGIVVNDSLVMINKINHLLQKQTITVSEAVIEGARSRMRPILMTSLTTVVGIAPLAYGWLGSEPFLAPMAVALMWGLIISTIILLVLLPVFYLIMHKIMLWLAQLLDKIFHRGSGSRV